MKKFIALLLVTALLCFSLCGCENIKDILTNNDEENTEINENSEKILKLAYSKNDSLNPFETETLINSQIINLVYNGLFKCDKTYNPQPELARSGVVSGNKISVILGENQFSDGSTVGVNDVIYSFYLAKESTLYETRLENIINVTASSANMLMFDLGRNDPYALACLDFPIIKKGSDTVNKNSTDAYESNVKTDDNLFPVAAGRYVIKKHYENMYLLVNSYKSDFNPEIKTIILEAVHDSDSVGNSLVIGNTGFYYDDLSSGSYNRLNAKSIDIGINNMVYLGFNDACPFFYSEFVRQAVSCCLDRSIIASSAFCCHARESALPFNPEWSFLENINANVSKDKSRAEHLIIESEINPKNGEIAILYNMENDFKAATAEYIKTCLEDIGFIVRLVGRDAEDFKIDLRDGRYDIYIGEVKLTQNMDLSPMFDGTIRLDFAGDSLTSARYFSMLDGSCGLMDFINTFNEEMPFVPLCFRNAVVSYTKSMDGNFAACDCDVFCDIDSWSLK